MAQTYLLIALGGAVGANARFVAASLVASRWGTRLPWGTLLINVTGSFLLGFSLAVPVLGTGAGRALLATGFCGGYTTFSTFAFETVVLAEGAERRFAALNALVSVGLCLIAAFGGGTLGTLIGR
ncbi:MAG TPA: fluoride efflux transporter CrcB [Thermomicrobiales bacterium]|jgi:CrcB protein